MRIEDARDDDLPAILAIYNDVLRTSTAIYRDEPAAHSKPTTKPGGH